MNAHARLRSVLVLCHLAVLSCALSVAQQAQVPQNPPFTIEVQVNSVLVPVVVRDKQGREVGDLKKEDFQVSDNGKPRVVSAFAIEKREAAEASTEGAVQPPVSANAAPQSPPPAQSFIVFLFDDMHLSDVDLGYAQKVGAKALDDALAGSNLAAVASTSGQTNSGLTRDRARLQEALMSLRSRGSTRSSGLDCPNVDYYQADQIVNKQDATALAGVVYEVLDCYPRLRHQGMATAESIAKSAAMQALMMGHQDVMATNAAIGELVLKMAALPGRRTLILVSPGFFNVERDAMSAESRILDLAAQSNVTISALDARGVYTTADTAGGHLQASSMRRNEERSTSMVSAETVMEELADGTGGTFLHGSNDLDLGLKSLAEGPEYLYVLELRVDDVKPNGSYHRLKVTVNRDGLQLQARHGYTKPKPEKQKK